MDLLNAALVTLVLVLVVGRLWHRRDPRLRTYHRLSSREQRRVAASVYSGGDVAEGAEDGESLAARGEAAREFEDHARRLNRPGPTTAIFVATTAVFLIAASLFRGTVDPALLAWVVPFWVAVYPGVLRWQRLVRRDLDGQEPRHPTLFRRSPVRYVLTFVVQLLPLTVLLTNITMMAEAATGIESDVMAGGVHGGLTVAYMVWLAPSRSVRETLPVFVGWIAVLGLIAGALVLAGVRPTDAL